jgi:hypothetical protein
MTFDDTFDISASTHPKSFLIADCGTVNTTMALFDQSAGSYRLIARTTVPTTAADPWENIHQGVKLAANRIMKTTGRTLLSKSGNLIRPSRANGSGVDAFTAVVSAAPPFKTLLVGLFDGVSLETARRSLHANYIEIVDTFSLADSRSEGERISSIIQQKPDLIFVVGGTDGGAEEPLLKLIEPVRIGIQALSSTKQPRVIFAGNINLRGAVREVLGENIHLHVADNIRPTLTDEQTENAASLIKEIYEDIQIGALPGVQELNKWSAYPIQPTANALATVAGYFAELQNGQVMAVDLGSNHASIVSASPDSKPQLYVRSDLGMGQPINNLLAIVPSLAITRWLPLPVSELELQNFIHNKSLYPQTIPMTASELQIEQAIAREIVRCTYEDAKAGWHSNRNREMPLRLLLARGELFAASPRPNQTMLILLDTLQPTGIFPVVMDSYGVLPAMGVLAAQEPLAAVQALEGGALTNLGWVVAPTGKGQSGQKVLNVLLESDQTQRLEVEVEYGTIEVLPLAPGQSAKVTLNPARRFDIGFGPGKGKTVNISGGTVGLVIDARSRPLTLPTDNEDREAVLRQWLWDIGG